MKRVIRLGLVVGTGLLLAWSGVLLAGERWPEFRGPRGDGHADAKGLPLRWDEKTNVVWKTAIHDRGWSSPVIWDEQIWLTTATAPAESKGVVRNDHNKLYAVCLDRASGKVVHDLLVFDDKKPGDCHSFNSYASPTPAIEAGRVYVHFGSPGTACLDTATGKTLWERRDLSCDHFRGAASSPILHGDLLILTFDGFDFNYVAALNKKTGETVWKTDRNLKYSSDNGDLHKAYSTPTVIRVGGKDLLISPAADYTQALDLESGKEVWKVKHGGMNVSARPLFVKGRLYLTSGYPAKLLAVRPDGSGDVTSTHVDWTFAKEIPTRPSLTLAGGVLYLISDGGVLTAVEAEGGKEIKKVRPGSQEQYSASPLVADGRLYLFSQSETAHVFELGSELKEVAANKLDEGCMATPAVAGKALYIRTKTHLYRIEEK